MRRKSVFLSILLKSCQFCQFSPHSGRRTTGTPSLIEGSESASADGAGLRPAIVDKSFCCGDLPGRYRSRL